MATSAGRRTTGATKDSFQYTTRSNTVKHRDRLSASPGKTRTSYAVRPRNDRNPPPAGRQRIGAGEGVAALTRLSGGCIDTRRPRSRAGVSSRAGRARESRPAVLRRSLRPRLRKGDPEAVEAYRAIASARRLSSSRSDSNSVPHEFPPGADETAFSVMRLSLYHQPGATNENLDVGGPFATRLRYRRAGSGTA